MQLWKGIPILMTITIARATATATATAATTKYTNKKLPDRD
jgi:hypothetical protein